MSEQNLKTLNAREQNMLVGHQKRCQFRDKTANVSLVKSDTYTTQKRQCLKSKIMRKISHASGMDADGSRYFHPPPPPTPFIEWLKC